MYRYNPRHIHHQFLRNLHIPTALLSLIALTSILSVSTLVLASATTTFRMVINPGVLAVDVVDGAFMPVANPLVDMGSRFQSTECQSLTGTFGTDPETEEEAPGTDTQLIYVQNPGVADNGWAVTLSAASPEDTWQGDGAHFDFNDPTDSGCTDGTDSDTYAGQMTVNPVVGDISPGACSPGCIGGGVTLGSSASFSEGTINAITLLSASPESSDSADWLLQGVTITQTIPQNQSVSDNYSLHLFLSVTAN